MFDESLLEFEESLSLISGSNRLLLCNLDLKVDLNRFSDTATAVEYTEEKILAVFADYDFSLDELTSCCTCGKALSENASSCCAKFIESHRSGFSSDLEKGYWLEFLNNPYKTVATLPNYTKMVFLQSGIPFQLRPVIWQKLIFVNQENHASVPEVSRMLYHNFQHSYNREIAKQINKDLSRTFPSVRFFQRPETIQSLLTVMNVYANYDLNLGYCQGLLFLVGTLFYHLGDNELTFHALCKIMECEPDLRSIFVPSSMSSTLQKWYDEFVAIFSAIDPELASHMAFCDLKVFLYQWWLSFLLIHAPDLAINNMVIDFCLIEGWKVGIFKISVGLLLRNRPILMTFGDTDEEVVYQHLLNESKWGSSINSLTAFFGDLLLSWDDGLFAELNVAASQPTFVAKKEGHKRSISVMDKLKNFSITGIQPGASEVPHGRSRSGSELSIPKLANRSLISVFSTKADVDSMYSDVTSTCSLDLPRDFKHRKASESSSIGSKDAVDELILENQVLKFLLKKAYESLGDETLKREITDALDESVVA